MVEPGNPKAVAKGILEALAGNVPRPTLKDVVEQYDTRASAERYWSLLFS
jgi:hypothetical protein